MSVQLDVITYDIELDIDSSGNATVNIVDGITVFENSVKVGNVRALDFRDGTNTTARVEFSGNRVNVYIDTSGGGTLSALTDVTLTSLAANDFLKYNGTVWINRTPAQVRSDLSLSEFIGIACSDETTVLSTASTTVPVATFHAPYAMTLTRVYSGLRTAGTGAAVVTVDIHVNGTTIMSSTKILFTASQKLSADGILTTTALAVGDYVEIFLDQRDTNNVATGLKTYLVGTK